MKRILYVIQLPPPVHGAAVINEIVANSALISGHFETRHVNISTSGTIEGIGKFTPSKIFSAGRHLALIIKNMIFFRPDLVYLTLSPAGFAFYRDTVYIFAIRLFRPRLVLHLHGKGIGEAAKKSSLYRWLCKKIFKGSYVIFLSESLRSDASSFTPRASFVVNNGLPVSASLPKPPSLAKEPVRILYLSNYVRSKGVLDLVDAIELVAGSHRNFHLTLAGKPYDISMDYLNEYSREKKLEEKVTIYGPKYKEEKIALLEEADIFIFPSYYGNEAFPLSILEAMQYTLPVVSTYEGGIPDMIEDGVNGLLFRQRDIRGLANKIIFLLDHPEERSRLGLAARKKFFDKYTISVFEQNILSVLRQIAEAS